MLGITRNLAGSFLVHGTLPIDAFEHSSNARLPSPSVLPFAGCTQSPSWWLIAQKGVPQLGAISVD